MVLQNINAEGVGPEFLEHCVLAASLAEHRASHGQRSADVLSEGGNAEGDEQRHGHGGEKAGGEGPGRGAESSDRSQHGAVGRGLHSLPFPLNLSLPCPFPLN